MKIYSKILTLVLLLMTVSLLGLSLAFYHIARKSLWQTSHELIHFVLQDGVRVVSSNLEVLRRFGLAEVPANVKKAQDESVRELSNIHFGKTGYIFVVDAQGIVQVHPDRKLVGQRIVGQAWHMNLKDNEILHIDEFSLGNEMRTGCVSFFEPWNWYLVCSQSQHEVLGTVNNLLVITLWATLGIFILTSAILLFFIRGITKPISVLTEASVCMARGENVEALETSSCDEIGILTRAFTQMQNAIQAQFVKIRESEERMELALRGGDLGTWDWDIVTGKVIFNERWAEMLGYSLDELEPHLRTWEKLVHLEDLPGVRDALNAHLEGKIDYYEAKHRLKHKSDGWVWVFTKGRVIERDVAGKALRACGTHLDITESKRAEAELYNLRNYLSNIIDSMPSILVGVDVAGKVTQWNKTAEEATGILAEIAKGKKLSDVLPEMTFQMGQITESVSSKKIKRELDQFRQTKDGPRYKDLTIYPLVTNGVEGVVIRIDDVTREHELGEQLNQSRKMDAIGQLAGGVAHDFNNMLAAIMIAAQMLKSPKRNLDKKCLECVDMIFQSVTRAADLTAKLLAFGHKGKIASTAIDLHRVVDETVAILKRTLDKKISILIEKGAENHTMVGDNSGLQNALMNLGINSSHAMPNGGEIKIKTKNIRLDNAYCEASRFGIEPGEYVEIEVYDTGCGIPAENLQNIFEPFFTTKEKGTGTGLGLAAVYCAVLDHHGAINVDSEVGTGTVFHIYLPCSEEFVEPRQINGKVLLGSGQILLVDDEEIIRIAGKMMLEDMGYEVLLAENGLEAVDIFQKRHSEIDLVMMDMIMPEMNGREAFFKMRGIDKNCKVVIASGFLKEESLDEMRQSGLAGFIQKPYKDYELSQLLADVLSH